MILDAEQGELHCSVSEAADLAALDARCRTRPRDWRLWRSPPPYECYDDEQWHYGLAAMLGISPERLAESWPMEPAGKMVPFASTLRIVIHAMLAPSMYCVSNDIPRMRAMRLLHP